MKLPNYEQAIVPRRKITDYLLSPAHRDGRSKAAFFTRFGFAIDTWEVFAHALRRHAADHNILEMEETAFGTSYTIEGSLVTPDGRAPRVRVVWFIDSGAPSRV